MKAFFYGLFLLSACSSSTLYELPSLPFQIVLPHSYGFLESDSTYIFSPENGPATLIFEKEPTERAFFELFEGGYEELTSKSSGVWVICETGNWRNCFVQNMDFPELYPLRIQSDQALNSDEEAEVRELLHSLRRD